MKTIAIILSCAFIAPFAFAQTGITRETTITTTQTVATLDSTHVMAVNAFAPGDKIVVQTAPATQPMTVRLDKGVSYVNGISTQYPGGKSCREMSQKGRL